MIDNQTLAAVALVAAVLWLVASRLPWAKWLHRTPVVPTETTEAEYLAGDYNALERLQARAIRFSNPAMDDALTIVSEQFLVVGEGWEDAK